VIARTCELASHERLRFVRVRTPSRPAVLAYPAFVLAASLLAARHRGGLLHTTGAIVLTRADVSTVHYCHRAARARVDGFRASRPGVLYRANAAVAAILAEAGEAWCYQPARSRLLCAVSDGVAAELRERFPGMANAVRTVPNGVDPTVFRPDADARIEVRMKLSIEPNESLALFVGGDWQRKGLVHAVDALSTAPGWHLAVAGQGDGGPIFARASRAGTEPRLHLLGPVRAMSRVYAAADVFVLPTAYETFSLVTFEAASTGLPLLVTQVSGVDELLEDGDNGWFIARDGRDIARRMNELRSSPQLARRMGDRARAAASAFSWEAMADGYTSVYRELERGTPASEPERGAPATRVSP
jgi:UDP-glucose:(heptosyl)LPS alpha-1,3-glucosyltransferase